MSSLAESGVVRGLLLVTLLLASGGVARGQGEAGHDLADDVELDAPGAPHTAQQEKAPDDTLWDTPFQRVVWLTAQGTLASSAAFLVGGLVVGVPWYAVFGLSTLYMLGTQNTFFAFPCFCLTATPLAAACGALGAYSAARLAVPYVAYMPRADRLGSRLMFGLASNLVDVAVHAAALAAALVVFTLLAGVMAAVGVASALSLVMIPSFQNNNAASILFAIIFYGALSMVVPGALAGAFLLIPPALLAAQFISPALGLLANQRLQAAADGSAPEPDATQEE